MSDQQDIQKLTIQYEARLLGSLLLNAQQFDDVAELVGFDDFVGPNHSNIFQAIQALHEAREEVHPLSVSENLAKSAALMGATSAVGLPFLQEMANDANPTGARSDAKKVRERAALRRVADTAKYVVELASVGNQSAAALMEQISEQVEATGKTIESRGPMLEVFTPYARAMEDYLTRLNALAENPEISDGVKTGIEDLDAYLSSLDQGYHVIAARPGMGKTALCLAMLCGLTESTERNKNAPVSAFFQSMDMRTEILMRRLLAQESGVDMKRLRRGNLSKIEWDLVGAGIQKLDKLNSHLWIDQSSNVTTADFKARIRRFKKEKQSRNGVVIVDYLQQMRPPENMRLRDTGAADYVSKVVKEVAKEEGLVIVALAQLNREVEKRANKRPVMSDLKASGQIEQDADSIMFLHRDLEYAKDIMEVIIAKNREGEPNFTIDLGFDGRTQRVYQVAQRTPEERMGTPAPERQPQRGGQPAFARR